METEHSVRSQTLRDITDSISDLYRSIMANYDEFEKPQDLGYFSRDSTKALGKLIAFNKDEAKKAENLLARLHSELQMASSGVRGEVSEEHVQDKDGQGEDTMWEKVEGYSMAWLQALEVIQKIFGMFAVKAKQMEEFWEKTDKLTVMDKILEQGEDEEGSELLYEIVDGWFECYGTEDVRNWLDQFCAKTEREKRYNELMVYEASSKREIDKTRQQFEKVLNGVKKEMKDLKVESEGLRGELETLKKKRKRV